MKKIPVGSLKPGMQFTKPVFVDEADLLVPENVEIRQKDIERLAKWKVESVMTDGEVITEAAELLDVAETLDAVLDERVLSERRQFYRTSVAQSDRIFSQIKVNREVDTGEIDVAIGKLMAATDESRDEMLAFVLKDERSEATLGLSAVNVVILTTLVGKTLKMDDQRLRTLTTASYLHDVGMVRVPDAILNKNANLNNDEIKQMRTHTLHSYQIISKSLGYSDEIGMIALQHHERWDGQGYPRKLAKKNISMEARILSVADAFEAMVKEKPYRNSMIAFAAMRQLLNDNSRRFDTEVLRVFIQSVGLYPLGSLVLLNNGSIGRVIKVNDSAPLRPAVRLLVDKTGKKLENEEGAILNLEKEKEVFIARAIDPKTISAKKSI